MWMAINHNICKDPQEQEFLTFSQIHHFLRAPTHPIASYLVILLQISNFRIRKEYSVYGGAL